MPFALPAAFRRPLTNIPLRWVLTIPFMLPTIGAVTLVGYLSYQSGQRAVTDLAEQLTREKGDQIALYLERTMEVPHLVNQLNADSIRLGQLPDLETQDPAPLEKILWTQLLRFPDVTSIAFANERGGMVGSGRRYESQAISMSVYRTPQFARGTYSLSTTNAQGDITETKVIAQNYDVRTRPWYQTPVRAGKATWSPIYQYVSDLDTLGISAGLPLYANSGALQGVLTTDINLKKLNDFLSGLDISASGQVFIVERSGLLVASSTNQSLSTTQAGKKERLKAAESENPVMRETMAQLVTHFDTLTKIQTTEQFTIKQAASKLVRVIPFQDQYGLDWLIVVVVPKSDFMEAIHANQSTTVLLSLLTLGGALGVGMLAANRLTARFGQLNRVSRELATGNLDQQLPTDGAIYELNGLAQSFNQMADQLRRSFEQIQTALEESEEKFTTIFRSSPDPMAIASLAEGRILEVNDSLIEFFGYSRAEMIGHTALELNLWSNLEQRDHYRALLEQQRWVRNLEVQLQTKSGQIKTALLSAEVQTLEGQERLIVMQRDISNRKATELALQQSEARYRAIVEDQTELIVRFLPDTTLLFVNDAYCRYFGVTWEGVIGQSYNPAIYEPDRDRVAELLQSLSVENPTVVIENRVVANGSVRWTQWVNRLLFDQQGNAAEIQAVGRDITELKQIEEALRKSEANLLQAQRIAHIGSWELDLITQEITWSEELFHIFGLDPALVEPSYPELLETIPNRERQMLVAAVEQAVAGCTSYEIEHCIRRCDGTLRYVISKGQAMLSEQPPELKLYGTILDITERKQIEIALQASEAKFQEIAQTLNQVSYVISVPTGQYLYISPAYEKLWGYSCESLYQDPRSWLDRIHPEDLDDVLQTLNQLFAGIQRRVQYRIFAANGEIRWIESESLIVHDDDGNPLRIVGLADDITNRKLLEQSLRSQAEEEHLLVTITQNIRQSLELEQILATTVFEVQQTLKADRALIFRLNQDGSGQVIQEAVVPQYPVTDQMRWEDEHFSQDCYEYYRQGKPRVVPDVTTDQWAECLTAFMQELGVKSKVVAPIVQAGDKSSRKVWGLLIVHSCSHRRQWQDSEVDFLQRIGDQLAIAIDQANLYQQLQIELAERKQAEEALQEREAMLRAIGDNLPKGFIYQRIYEPGKGSYYSYVSAGVERLLGLKPEDILSNPATMRTIGFEEDLAHADQVVQASLKNLTPIELEMRNRTATGEIQWSSIRSVPRRLEDGRTVWDGVEVDITNLKQIEAALRVSEEQFRRAFDDAPIGISLVAPTGQFLKTNTYYCNLLGYTEAELLTLTFQEITHPADLNADLEGFQQLVNGEVRSLQIEKRFINRQGAVIPVLVNAAPVRDQDGKPLYIVGHIQDIRDRLKVERMKDEFISIVSHELRTPLTSIRGALGILGSGVFDSKPEKASHMLRIAINNSDRLVRLVDDILSLERLESGKVQLVRELCQVADLMQQAVDSVQSLADQANITLVVVSLSATLWVAPDAIIQTLTNLLSNAIKFSSAGDTIWLQAEIVNYAGKTTKEAASASPTPSFQPPTTSVLFTVRDQGRGIPEDKFELIFEQFQQVDVSDSGKKGGTGLGLAICKRIVQQHGGQIWVESQLGKGSTFYVVLPLIVQDENE